MTLRSSLERKQRNKAKVVIRQVSETRDTTRSHSPHARSTITSIVPHKHQRHLMVLRDTSTLHENLLFLKNSVVFIL